MQGDLFEDDCPKGELLIGLEGRQTRDSITKLRGICGRPAFAAGQQRLTLEETGTTPWRGNDEGDDWRRACLTDEMIVAFDVLASPTVRGIRIYCVSALVDADGDDFAVKLADMHVLDVVGMSSGLFVDSSCRAGSAAGGPRARVGPPAITAVGLRCRTMKISDVR